MSEKAEDVIAKVIRHTAADFPQQGAEMVLSALSAAGFQIVNRDRVIEKVHSLYQGVSINAPAYEQGYDDGVIDCEKMVKIFLFAYEDSK